jgi:NADH-quinone oxidoreductase subunit C
VQLPDVTATHSLLAKAGIDASCAEEAPIVVCRVTAGDIVAALTALRDGDAAYAYLVDLFGVDTGEGLEVTYHLRSFARDEELFVRVTVDYDAEVPSVWTVYPGVLYPERETAELFGMTFPGHPNPKRLLTTDEVELPLLRRSTAIRTPEEVHARD